MINHINTVAKLLEVSRDYKLPLCLPKKAFNSIETEVVVEVLITQGVHIQHVRVLRGLYTEFTAKIPRDESSILLMRNLCVSLADHLKAKAV